MKKKLFGVYSFSQGSREDYSIWYTTFWYADTPEEVIGLWKKLRPNEPEGSIGLSSEEGLPGNEEMYYFVTEIKIQN